LEKYRSAGQATDDNTKRRMRSMLDKKAANTYSECEVFMLLGGNSGYANAPHYYVYTHFASLVYH
jgi:hypothetical protein